MLLFVGWKTRRARRRRRETKQTAVVVVVQFQSDHADGQVTRRGRLAEKEQQPKGANRLLAASEPSEEQRSSRMAANFINKSTHKHRDSNYARRRRRNTNNQSPRRLATSLRRLAHSSGSSLASPPAAKATNQQALMIQFVCMCGCGCVASNSKQGWSESNLF